MNSGMVDSVWTWSPVPTPNIDATWPLNSTEKPFDNVLAPIAAPDSITAEQRCAADERDDLTSR